MRLRSSYFSKIQDLKDYLDVFIGRSCAGALDVDSFDEFFNKLEVFYGDLEFTDVKSFLK